MFSIKSNNENISISSSYLFGTIHVAQNLVWPYLSNKTLQILNESDEIWLEQDFTVPEISKYIYGCSIDKMSIKERARLRAKSWSLFLNETKGKSDAESTKSNSKFLMINSKKFLFKILNYGDNGLFIMNSYQIIIYGVIKQ